VVHRFLGLLAVLAVALGVSGCTSCGKLDQFQAPTFPKLCHADTVAHWRLRRPGGRRAAPAAFDV